MPALVVGFIAPTPSAIPPLLLAEMAVMARRAAGESVAFEIVVNFHRPSYLAQQMAKRLQLRVDEWHFLRISTDDCRIAFDWYVERHGISNTLLWDAHGPTKALRAGVALNRRMPTDVVTELPIPCVWQNASHWPVFPWRGDVALMPAGRHAGHVWLAERGAVGDRLLALWTAAYDTRTEAADFASMDVTIRRLARVLLQATPDPSAPDPETCRGWVKALRARQMNIVLARWLNAAERRLDAGQPVNLALPRILGLSEASQLRIIP